MCGLDVRPSTSACDQVLTSFNFRLSFIYHFQSFVHLALSFFSLLLSLLVYHQRLFDHNLVLLLFWELHIVHTVCSIIQKGSQVHSSLVLQLITTATTCACYGTKISCYTCKANGTFSVMTHFRKKTSPVCMVCILLCTFKLKSLGINIFLWITKVHRQTSSNISCKLIQTFGSESSILHIGCTDWRIIDMCPCMCVRLPGTFCIQLKGWSERNKQQLGSTWFISPTDIVCRSKEETSGI